MDEIAVKIKTGDEVIFVGDEFFDVLTVLRVVGDYAECFEYNPQRAIVIPLCDLEKL